MKKKMSLLLISSSLFFLLFAVLNMNSVFGQISGNQVYGYNRANPGFFTNTLTRLYLKDGSFIIEAKIMKNVLADHYIVVMGVNQEADSVQKCHVLINKRINAFVSRLKKAKISSSVYVDLITQNRVYDFKQADNTYIQYVKGFELKKNVIIHVEDKKLIDKIMIIAAKYEILDIIKVDYLVKDIQMIYNQLFLEAVKVIKHKKKLYTQLTEAQLAPVSQIYGEQFSIAYPANRYKKYNAFESSSLSLPFHRSYPKLFSKKVTSFYYDKVNYAGFDKIVNPVFIEPAIQFILVVQVKFSLQNKSSQNGEK